MQAESEQFPGQFHRWILSRFLIKGQLKVQESFLCDMAKAAYLMGKQIFKIVKSRYMLYANPSFMDYNSGGKFLRPLQALSPRGVKDPKE